jgi:hypothetical protein
MHWLGQYEIKYITDGGVVQVQDLEGKEIQGLVNGSQLKLYKTVNLVTLSRCSEKNYSCT